MRLLRQALLALIAALPAIGVPGQVTPDIYAKFHIRSGIDDYYFRVWLDRPCAPTAVANFLGLVTGSRAWLDSSTGLPSTEPFYTGTQVYKIVPGSEIVPGAPVDAAGEIHFGSPTNDGMGGPGYVFQDISLVPPGDGNDGPWQVYMENNGPNTNGSRFFISGLPQNYNDRYTRLGVVQPDSGAPYPFNNSYLNLSEMSKAPRDASGRPNRAQIIKDITIEGWDENDPFELDTWQLPELGPAAFRIVKLGGLWKLFGFARPGSVLTYQSSPDLENWGPLQTHLDSGTSFGIDISNDLRVSPRGFYRGSSVFYPQWPSTDLDLSNATLIFDYTDLEKAEIVKIQLDFNAGGSGGDWLRWVNGDQDDPGIFSATYSSTGPFKGELAVTRLTGTTLADFTFRLHFEYHFPVEEVVDRFEAFTEFLPPVLPESQSGTWRQLP